MARNESLQDERTNDQISIAEWVIAAVAALVLLALFGFLIYDVIRDNNQPPQLETSVQAIHQTGNDFLVQFQVHNSGDRTAADVTIEAMLQDGTTTVESHTTTIDYVPPYSSREGGIFFTRDPSQFTLQVHATAYQNP